MSVEDKKIVNHVKTAKVTKYIAMCAALAAINAR